MKRRIAAISLLLLTLLLIAWGWLRDNKLPAFRSELEIFVRPGTSASDVLEMVSPVAKWPGRLDKVFRRESLEGRIKPGHYTVRTSDPAVYVPRMLKHGWQTPVRVSLSGTLRDRGDIAGKIAAQMLLDSASVRESFENDSLLALFGLTPATLFEGLLQDTYEVWWTDPIEALLKKQKSALDHFWTPERLDRAKALGLSRSKVSVLASIVSSETTYVPEMPRIAGVYLNRLRRGMRLQADPTIAFCFDYKVNRILRKMLDVDSPFNTYRNAGLPPAPICVPGREALDAVLYPDFGPGNLYFCADPALDGTHRFAASYSEHLKNAREFYNAR